MSLKLEVKSVRLIVVDPTLQGRPPASAQDAPETGAKNRGKIGANGARKRSPLGLGDVVERVAKPIAVKVDAINAWGARHLGTKLGPKLATCGACSWRRKMLNLLVPDVRSLASWRSAWAKLPIVWRARRARTQAKRRG
jgi:hypothetical protein